METKEQKLKAVDMDLGEIELPSLDLNPYVGKKVKVAKAQTFESKYGYVLKVETDAVDMLGDKPLCGSRIFGIHTDEEGNSGWGANTKLGVFMKKMRATTVKDLVGKEVVLQIREGSNGGEFLSFA